MGWAAPSGRGTGALSTLSYRTASALPLTFGNASMICVAVTYVIRAGHEDEALAHFRALTPLTRAEPGCRMYLVHRSLAEPRRFFLYEQYDDQAALDAHRAALHFAEHVVQGLFTILESRTPELYEPIPEA